jgi:hypothetical protein
MPLAESFHDIFQRVSQVGRRGNPQGRWRLGACRAQ